MKKRLYWHNALKMRTPEALPGNILCLVLSLLLGIMFILADIGPVSAAAEPNEPTKKLLSSADTPLSLDQCIGMALVQSPYMKVHDLKVEIKGLDTDDAWYQMFPKINLQLTSNVPVIQGTNSKKASSSFRATLTTGTYDPISASISHEAQLDLTQLAKYAKLETATDLIRNTVAVYIQERTHAARMTAFDKMIKLAQNNLAFVSQSYPNAPTIPLDVKLAEHQIDKLKTQKARLLNTRTNTLMRLKRMLGIPIEQKLELETKNMEHLLFLSFDSSKLTFEQIRSHSIKAKMAKLSLKLAENNILAAWAKYVPKFAFSIRTPDPVNNDDNKDDSYYFTLNMTAPLWHWGELQRGRERAHLQKQQALTTTQADWLEFEDQWYTNRSNEQLLRDTRDLAHSEMEIRALNVRKAEIMFNAGRMRYDDYIRTESTLIQSQIDMANAQEAYLLAKLDAYATSGELLRRFVTVVNENDTND